MWCKVRLQHVVPHCGSLRAGSDGGVGCSLASSATPLPPQLRWVGSLPTAARRSNLLSLLTLDEKIGMLGSNSPMPRRLGLPPYQWWNEAMHGVAHSPGSRWDSAVALGSATSFPAPIGSAAALNRELWRAIVTTISAEASQCILQRQPVRPQLLHTQPQPVS